jgi:hypothetical protein
MVIDSFVSNKPFSLTFNSYVVHLNYNYIQGAMFDYLLRKGFPIDINRSSTI